MPIRRQRRSGIIGRRLMTVGGATATGSVECRAGSSVMAYDQQPGGGTDGNEEADRADGQCAHESREAEPAEECQQWSSATRGAGDSAGAEQADADVSLVHGRVPNSESTRSVASTGA